MKSFLTDGNGGAGTVGSGWKACEEAVGGRVISQHANRLKIRRASDAVGSLITFSGNDK
ncbi:MAG TPA: hypothetical protein H9807_07830 [Candidatus Bacteroides merdavium]|uniref:Uncharacterized protein n=1 Tax=Candidatus Bacteroides merdavium TaxID=2838472 RepID=A0A9D2GXZ4_9BACE|nr:hypothetical protein [Candidatus Bacteroides merdavium]